MPKTEHRVSVDNGKYTFVVPADDYRISILRYGEPWHGPQGEASNAIHAIMCELDAARVVLEAARQVLAVETLNGRGDNFKALARALATHDACVGPQPRPTEWARSYCLCSGGDDGGHGVDCDRS